MGALQKENAELKEQLQELHRGLTATSNDSSMVCQSAALVCTWRKSKTSVLWPQPNEEQAALLEAQAATIKQQAALVQKLQVMCKYTANHPCCTLTAQTEAAAIAARESDMQTQLQTLQASLAERNDAVTAQLREMQDANAQLTSRLQHAKAKTAVKRHTHAAAHTVHAPAPSQQAPAAMDSEHMAALHAEVCSLLFYVEDPPEDCWQRRDTL